MRHRVIGFIIVAFCLSHEATAQDIPLAFPGEWMDGNPTARSFAMGFSGVAAADNAPSVLNPASLGIWALAHNVYQMHNWERGRPGEGVFYDFANTVDGFGACWTPKNMERPPTLSLAMLYREGHYRAGPFRLLSPNMLEEYNISDERQSRAALVGGAIRVGAEFALGAQVVSVEETEIPLYIPEYDGPMVTPKREELVESYQVRIRALHFLQTWGLLRTMPSIGGVLFDVYGVQGGTFRASGGMTGFAFGLQSSYAGLPVLSAEYARDRDGSTRNYGWEVDLLGVAAIRYGNRDLYWPTGTFFDSEGNVVVQPDWSTEGFALDFGNAQRWVLHVLDIQPTGTVSWILDRIEMRYETASFRHPDAAPPGLGQMSVREWTVGFSSF